MANIFNDSNFQQEVLNSELPVVVDFYADWCGPCKMIGPVIEQLAEAYAGKIKVGKVNVDENMELASQYRIMSIPAVMFFKDGKVQDQIIGAVPKAQIEAKFQALL
ncbi:MAG: thioredoxin [Firmicutes bacterium]|nr:thioredoxin [Bacillota bacterium]